MALTHPDLHAVHLQCSRESRIAVVVSKSLGCVNGYRVFLNFKQMLVNANILKCTFALKPTVCIGIILYLLYFRRRMESRNKLFCYLR